MIMISSGSISHSPVTIRRKKPSFMPDTQAIFMCLAFRYVLDLTQAYQMLVQVIDEAQLQIKDVPVNDAYSDQKFDFYRK